MELVAQNIRAPQGAAIERSNNSLMALNAVNLVDGTSPNTPTINIDDVPPLMRRSSKRLLDRGNSKLSTKTLRTKSFLWVKKSIMGGHYDSGNCISKGLISLWSSLCIGSCLAGLCTVLPMPSNGFFGSWLTNSKNG